MAILKYRDQNGNIKELVALRGEKGEDITKLLRVTVADGYASHTPAEIKAFRDGGGLVVLNDNALLVVVNDDEAFFTSHTNTMSSVTTMEYSITTDKRVFTTTLSYNPSTDKMLVMSNIPADAGAVGQRFTEMQSELDNSFVKKEDIFQGQTNGVIRANGAYGTTTKEGLYIGIQAASTTDIDEKTNKYRPLTCHNLEYAVKSVTYDKAEIDAMFAALEARLGG